MRQLEFSKLQAAGNDFILINAMPPVLRRQRLNYKTLARKYCPRKSGIGADGVLVIEPAKKEAFRMRIFNPDGSEAEMCGNGARCVALWAKSKIPPTPRLRLRRTGKNQKSKTIEFITKAGVIKAEVRGQNSNFTGCGEVRIKMTEIFGMKFDLPIKVSGRTMKVNYINTGIPHTVVFAEGLDTIDVASLGRQIRFHNKFAPRGTNVDFVEMLGEDFIKIRTYERGVEAETLACGTGVVAAALITSYKLKTTNRRGKFKVLTKSGEKLKVYFDQQNGKIENVWLEGKAYLVYKGVV